MKLDKKSFLTARAAIFGIAGIFLALTACGNIEAKQDEPVWVHEVSDLAVYPGVVYGQLDNGMRYALMKNDTPSNQAVLRMQIAVGSLYEEDDQQGLAHFIEHMAFNGTTNVPEGEMIKILERKGLAFGADTNASTGYDYTTYILNLPETDEDMIDTSLFLMRETASEILFNQDAIDRERGVVQSEKRSRQSPGADAGKAQGEFFTPHALANKRYPIGTDVVLATAQRDRFVDLYEKYYTPERTIIVMVGDFDVVVIEQKIKDAFSDWKRSSHPGSEPDRGHIEERGLVAGVHQHADIGTRFSLVIMRPPTFAEDTVAERQRGLPHMIANRVINQRLGVRSREKDAPFFGAGVSFSFGDTTGKSLADTANYGVSSPPEKWRAALSVVEQEVRRALKYGFSQAEINEQIANMRSGAENAVTREGTRSSGSFVGGILGSYGAKSVFTHPKLNLELFNKAVALVTPETVFAAFQEEWKGGEPRLFMTSSDKVTKEELIAAYKNSQSQSVNPPEKFDDAAFAYTNIGTPGKVVWRDEIEDFGIIRTRLDNNVMVNLKRTEWQKGLVNINVRISGGAFARADDMKGLGGVLGSSFISGGLEAHDLDALQRITAGRNVGLGFGAGVETFNFSGTTLPKDFLLQLQLWIAYMQHPAWRDQGLAKMHSGLARRYELRGSSVGSALGWALPPLLHSGDPRWDILTEEEARAATIADTRAWIEEPLANGAIEIAVVGDIDLEVALEAISKTFGALPKREAEFRKYPEKEVAPKFPAANTTPHVLYHRGEKNRAVGRTYWPTTDGKDTKAARTATLLKAVLQLKLIAEVREKQGGTYSPGSFNSMSSIYDGYGYMGVNLDVEPEKIDDFFDVVDKIASELAAGNISEDELERARAPIMESITQALENNGYWMNNAARAQSHEEDIEKARTREADYRNLTVADLTAFAAKYLVAERAWRVKAIPQEEK